MVDAECGAAETPARTQPVRTARRTAAKIPHHLSARQIARRMRQPAPICFGIVRRLKLAAVLGVLALFAAWPAAPSAQAAGGALHQLEGQLRPGAPAAAFPLFAAAGETWELSVGGLRGRARLAVVDPRDEAIAAHSGGAPRLRWTAPQTGVWRVRIEAANVRSAEPFTLRAQRLEDIGGGFSSAAPLELASPASAIAQGVIDWPGDEDWFSVGLSAGSRYAIYTVLGSLAGTRGEVLLPGASGPAPLWVHANGKTSYRELTPSADGAALIRSSGADGGVGSFALGAALLGGGELRPGEPPPRAEHTLLGAQASVRPGELAVELRADWAPFDAERRAAVWLDVDQDGRWDHIAQTRDGWRTRLWSISGRRWLDADLAVESNGFDSLILRVPTRGFGAQVRWRAAVRRSAEGWQSRPDAAGAAAPLPPIPQRPRLWNIYEPSGTPQQRQAALSAAGIGAAGAAGPIVVLDPGHGGEELGGLEGLFSEADSNLRLARAVAALLEAEGVQVVLTRGGGGLARLNFSGAAGRADLHARIDLAHLAGADLFVSLHSNAAHNDWQRGLEGWYYPSPAGDGINRELAEWLLDALSAELADWGYRAPVQIFDSSCWEIVADYCDPLYVLAPYLLVDHQAALDWGCDPEAMGLSGDPWDAPPPIRYPTGPPHTKGVGPIDLVDPERQVGPASVVRGTMMPAVLLELLYMTHEPDMRVLLDAGGRAALARGAAAGILSWLRRWGQLSSG